MEPTSTDIPECDILIIGAGPAGATLAAFASRYDLRVVCVSAALGTANTPRAHLVNPFGLECLRELGLEDEAMRMAVTGDASTVFRWTDNLTSPEYGRVACWGSATSQLGEAVAASPCAYVDLPQSYLEPLLVRKATDQGVSLHFNTTFLSYSKDESGCILSTVKDDMTKREYQIRSRFLCGADGGRSQVAREMKVEFDSAPGGAYACNVIFEADCDHLMAGHEAQLHWCVGAPMQRRFGVISCLRMVRPWKLWWLGLIEGPEGTGKLFKDMRADDPELLQLIRELIGHDDVPFKIQRMDPWRLRESVAQKFHDGNVFVLGDAAHRHTPSFGLGSNTSMQDAYNLAWKLAYVSKGIASQELLNSFTPERQPVGTKLVKASTGGMMSHMAVWKALGAFTPTHEGGVREREELAQPTPEGEARRVLLHNALEAMRVEGESLGMQMNQQYVSNAVYLHDETPRPPFKGNDITDGIVTTYPGSRLPHAWLADKVPSRKISTTDLTGHGAFSLFIGHGGEAWRKAAEKVSESLKVPIKAYAIGWGLDFHDKDRAWIKRREVEEDGCILVRPDNFVAWRSTKMIPNCVEKLNFVLKSVLSRKE